MSHPILLSFTCSDLGLYRLDVCAAPAHAETVLERTARATAEALCAAINAGIADEAVYQALDGRLDDAGLLWSEDAPARPLPTGSAAPG